MSLLIAEIPQYKLPKNKFFTCRVNKIVKMIKKIRHLVSSEGIDQRIVTGILLSAICLNHRYIYSEITSSKQISQLIAQRLNQDGDKFAVSLLKKLNQQYKQLRNELESEQSQQQNECQIIHNSRNMKLQQFFPSFHQSKQKNILVKLQQQALQQNQNTFQKQISKQKNSFILQKIQEKKRWAEKYLQRKMQKLKKFDRTELQDQEECNRKYGPKVQMERHNYQELQQVKKLRQRLLGNQKINRKHYMRKKEIALFRKQNTKVLSTVQAPGNLKIRQLSH